MNDNHCATVAERRRGVEPSLLRAFDEIAQNCLKLARDAQEGVNPLQNYLDGRIAVGGASYQRRMVLLAIHDMTEEREAPLGLQRKALAQLILLQMSPIPKLALYRDIATAILRMEVVIRLSATQRMTAGTRQPVHSFASSPHWDNFRQWCQSSADAVSARLAGWQAALPELHAPRLAGLTLGGLLASSLRAVISI
jgi:hypothetical protein